MQFVMSNRRAGKFQETEKIASRAALSAALTALPPATHIQSQTRPDDDLARHSVVLEGTPAEMLALDAATPSDVIVEPLILHEREGALSMFKQARAPLAGLMHVASAGAAPLEFHVRGGGAPLAQATVILFLRRLDGEVMREEARTGADGIAAFPGNPAFQPLAAIVKPYAGFWARWAQVSGQKTTVVCSKLPGNRRLDWWHHTSGISSFAPDAGAGIRVGVIDTGLGPHPHLQGTDHGAFILGIHDPDGGTDADVHGTHVAGTIAGRPGEILVHGGIAPGVELHSARVFPPGEGAANIDIADAIDRLSRAGADLINLSLGAPVKSEVVQDAVQDAAERGTLCLCAAANSFEFVHFPAALPETVAVSAAGKLGTAPEDSVSGGQLPDQPELFGLDGFYFARFSCFGPEIDAIAPGVGIIAPVPARHGLAAPYAALDGTSMATPVACGVLARVLAEDASYLAMPRNIFRSDLARHRLRDICRTIGLSAIHEGHGMPRS